MTAITGSSLDLTPDPTTENGVTVFTNNVSALEQADKRGVVQNIIYYDGDDNLILGPLREQRLQLFSYIPFNLTIRHINWDFNSNKLPDGLTYSGLGSYDFSSGDSRINLNCTSTHAGDAVSVQANNILTTRNRRTAIYFTLNLLNDDRNTDFQFGLRNVTGSDVVMFRYSTPSGAHSTINARSSRAGNGLEQPTAFNDITGRHIYCIEWEANGDVHFWIGNNINNLVLAYTIAAADVHLPLPDTTIVPFVQIRSVDVAQVRTAVIDTIYSIFAW